MSDLPHLDGTALIAALDAQRRERGLDWAALADVLWDQSHDLDVELADDCLCCFASPR